MFARLTGLSLAVCRSSQVDERLIVGYHECGHGEKLGAKAWLCLLMDKACGVSL